MILQVRVCDPIGNQYSSSSVGLVIVTLLLTSSSARFQDEDCPYRHEPVHTHTTPYQSTVRANGISMVRHRSAMEDDIHSRARHDRKRTYSLLRHASCFAGDMYCTTGKELRFNPHYCQSNQLHIHLFTHRIVLTPKLPPYRTAFTTK